MLGCPCQNSVVSRREKHRFRFSSLLASNVKKMSELLHQSCNIFEAHLLLKLQNYPILLVRKRKESNAYNLEALVLLYFVACKHFSIK
jgi:hypothetical protein